MCKASSSRRSFSLFSKAFICVCLRASFNDRLKLSIECPLQLLLVSFTRRISSVARFPQPSVSVFRACGGLLALSLSYQKQVFSRESLTCSSSERQPDIRLPDCVVDSVLVRTVTLVAMVSRCLYSVGSPVLEISRAFEMIFRPKSTNCTIFATKPKAV